MKKLNNTTHKFEILLLILLIFLAGCSNDNSTNDNSKDSVKEQITLGYCPTMSDLAKDIASKNSHVSLQPFGYTAQALQTLNTGGVDLVLVGRIAKKNEVNNAYEKLLGQGLTLVGNEKKLITELELQNSKIQTAVDENLAKEYLPNTQNIIFHKSTQSALKEGANDIVLIDWKDYNDTLELVIPVDSAGNKIKKFRIPVLYSNKEDIIQNLDV